jgi:phytanoyl-CoA hydroxylase
MTQITADRELVTQHPTRDAYEALGVLQVPGLLPADEVAEIRDVFTAKVEADASFGHDDNIAADDVLARYPRFVQPHRHLDTEVGRIARRLMLDRRILDVVQTLAGPVNAAQSMFYFKPPGARGQALHQDNMFLHAHPETCIAAWIAIDDCDGDNGGLMVVPGSHTQELLCTEPADSEESFTSVQVPVPDGVEIHQTQMRAGDVLFFHGSMVHGSVPNTTADRFRRSLIFHYVPQASTEVAAFYHPLISPSGEEVRIDVAEEGGACGEGWVAPVDGP